MKMVHLFSMTLVRLQHNFQRRVLHHALETVTGMVLLLTPKSTTTRVPVYKDQQLARPSYGNTLYLGTVAAV